MCPGLLVAGIVFLMLVGYGVFAYLFPITWKFGMVGALSMAIPKKASTKANIRNIKPKNDPAANRINPKSPNITAIIAEIMPGREPITNHT